ncbi:MAG: HPP family protein [Pirellulales bacterium]
MNLKTWLGIELIEVSATEKLISTFGGAISILALIGFSRWALPLPVATAVVASMGASAVLLFAVPHGPLSQPWPVIAGHGISAVIGVTCAQLLGDTMIAAACAVGFAIGAMQQLKCIHPPGGATAFTAVLGGQAVHDLGYRFIVFPILMNAAAMVLAAVLINGTFRWRRYPAAWNQPAERPRPISRFDEPVPTHEEVLAALRTLDSFVDISEEDLLRLTSILSHRHREEVRN